MLGTDNPADMMTKHLDQKHLDDLLRRINLEISEGRAAVASRLAEEPAAKQPQTKRMNNRQDVWSEKVQEARRVAPRPSFCRGSRRDPRLLW